jgi:hypothetical protein
LTGARPCSRSYAFSAAVRLGASPASTFTLKAALRSACSREGAQTGAAGGANSRQGYATQQASAAPARSRCEQQCVLSTARELLKRRTVNAKKRSSQGMHRLLAAADIPELVCSEVQPAHLCIAAVAYSVAAAADSLDGIEALGDL